MKSIYKLSQAFLLTFLFGLSLNCQAQSRDQIKYKCSVDAGPIQDAKTRASVYDKCLSLNGFVRDDSSGSLFDQPILTNNEKKQLDAKKDKEMRDLIRSYELKEASNKEFEQKYGRIRNKKIMYHVVTDEEGYVVTDIKILEHFIVRDRIHGDARLCESFGLNSEYTKNNQRNLNFYGAHIRPGAKYPEWFLKAYATCWPNLVPNSTKSQITTSPQEQKQTANQSPAQPDPPPQQITKLAILKKNSQFIFECIVVAQIFTISAEEKNADADLKKITKSLSDRYSGYGDQILTVTDELKSRAERMTQQFSNLDKDAQVGQWQRCNQWQP